jgi:hypothetical protein
MAPELFAGDKAGPQHDLYAAGVTLYHLLTQKVPVRRDRALSASEVRRAAAADALPPGHPRLARKRPPQGRRQGLRAALRNAEEFLLALERGANRPLSRPPVTPLAMRNPLLTWRIIAGVSLAINLLLLMMLTR